VIGAVILALLAIVLPSAELPKVTRPLKHGGNLRYLFGLTSAVKRRLPRSLPYPKVNISETPNSSSHTICT